MLIIADKKSKENFRVNFYFLSGTKIKKLKTFLNVFLLKMNLNKIEQQDKHVIKHL